MKETMIIAGGSGFFGSYLTEFFREDYIIKVLTRKVTTSQNSQFEQILWDGKNQRDWVKHLEGASVLINLSGKSINCRFTKQNRALLMSSRLESTCALNEALQSLENPPKMWLNASAGAMYEAQELPSTESTNPFKTGFLSEMSLAWEKEFFRGDLPSTRRVALRISLLLGKNGGVFPVWRRMTKLFMGGKVGSGQQIVSWMHVNDAARAIDFIIKNSIEGPVNFSSDYPISNARLMKIMRKTMGVPFGFPAPSFAVKLASPLVGAEASLLLDSVNFVSSVLKEKGFNMEYERFEQAANSLLNE